MEIYILVLDSSFIEEGYRLYNISIQGCNSLLDKEAI